MLSEEEGCAFDGDLIGLLGSEVEDREEGFVVLQLEALEGQKETQNKWEMTQPQAQTQTQTQKGASS